MAVAPLALDLAIAGLGIGAAAALSGIGLVLCHRATGVLNLAQGAIAMVTAYLLRECVVVWHWPRTLAVPVCVLLVAPALGVLMDVLVFRRLQRRGAGTAETLVAGLGVFVLLIGSAALLWGTTPLGDAPTVAPSTPLADWGGVRITVGTAVELSAVLLLALGVGAVSRWTSFGTMLRAVVDNRRLAELSGLDADLVSSVGWAFSAFTAGLTGVLLAPGLRLDPYGLPLLVMETLAVAVAAGLRSLPLAIAAALTLGIGQSELTALHPSGWAGPLLLSVGSGLFVLALLAVVLLPGRLPTGPIGPPGIPAVPAMARLRTLRPFTCLALLLVPLDLREADLRALLPGPALALVLLSVVMVTGYGGQISLGQAGYAGLGALFTGVIAGGTLNAPLGLPVLPAPAALLLAVVLAAPCGLLVGWPAIRRRGLALALTTFAVGTAMSRLVFQQPFLTTGLRLDRTGPWADDRLFYLAELVLLGAALLLVRGLHLGRTGRALGAMRDHEPAAHAAGVNVTRVKLLAFTTGSALAALGGGLLGLGAQAFDPNAFDPVLGLLWFAAVVVFGADSASGAVLAAMALTALDAATSAGVSAAAIGVLAVLRGRFPRPVGRGARRVPAPAARNRSAPVAPVAARESAPPTPSAPPSPRSGPEPEAGPGPGRGSEQGQEPGHRQRSGQGPRSGQRPESGRGPGSGPGPGQEREPEPHAGAGPEPPPRPSPSVGPPAAIRLSPLGLTLADRIAASRNSSQRQGQSNGHGHDDSNGRRPSHPHPGGTP